MFAGDNRFNEKHESHRYTNGLRGSGNSYTPNFRPFLVEMGYLTSIMLGIKESNIKNTSLWASMRSQKQRRETVLHTPSLYKLSRPKPFRVIGSFRVRESNFQDINK
jgi:hypothetical protein